MLHLEDSHLSTIDWTHEAPSKLYFKKLFFKNLQPLNAILSWKCM